MVLLLALVLELVWSPELAHEISRLDWVEIPALTLAPVVWMPVPGTHADVGVFCGAFPWLVSIRYALC